MTENAKRGEASDAPWFEAAFGDFYADLYAHRSPAEAELLLDTLEASFPLSGRVLDVACGAGRLVEALTARGLDAFGVDLSFALLKRALASDGGLRLARSDMRKLPVRRASFDFVFFLFTSFGYFDDPSEDAAVLLDAAKLLRPEGVLVLDFLNPRPTLKNLVPESERSVGSWKVEERRRFLSESRQIKKRVQVWGEGGIELDYEESVRVYNHGEFAEMFRQVGLKVEQTWGNYDGASYDEDDSPRMILCGQPQTKRE